MAPYKGSEQPYTELREQMFTTDTGCAVILEVTGDKRTHQIASHHAESEYATLYLARPRAASA
jgi:hypothetical protein